MTNNFDDKGGLVPTKPPPIQIQEVKCPQCGNHYRFAKLEHMVDYKKAYEDYRTMYQKLIHEVNELMAYSERTYSMNPAKDIMVDLLLKLREKFEEDY